MTHVITQHCCNDAACVPACPVNCIHPAPGEPGYGTAEMLYIDPEGCIDCGACIDVCPVGAIVPDYELPDAFQPYVDLNARWYADPRHRGYDTEPAGRPQRALPRGLAALRVAVVGSGPAALYAAEDLLSERGVSVQVDLFEKLPVPFGLVRYGVAPDHQDTKAVTTSFARTLRREGLRFLGNVEVGRDVSVDTLRERYDAVLLAHGAADDRPLDVPGEHLSGCVSATDLVAWYNGHPEAPELDLRGGRVVVVGNGNVAVDVARVLTERPEDLARTDIAQRALDALAAHPVTEVTLVARRGPGQAAFTTPELLGLLALDGVDLVVDPDDLEPEGVGTDGLGDPATSMTAYRLEVLREAAKAEPAAQRRIVLRFCLAPREVLGDERVEGLRVERTRLVLRDGRVAAEGTGELEDLPADLVVRSVGYRGRELPGVPFDDDRGVVPNVAGRVVGEAGLYVAGWVKRGPSGVIGSNRACARETVDALLADHATGLLGRRTEDDLAPELPDAVDLLGWRAIDDAERAAGRQRRAPRTKLVDVREMLRVAQEVQA